VNVANKTFKNITLGLAAAGAAFLMGCMGSEGTTGSQDQYGSLAIKVGTGDVNAASKSGLSKGSTISLSKLIVTMVSNSTSPTASDTIRDTIRAGVSQGFVSTSTADQTIDSVYVLKALRTWYITVKTLDTKDSLVHIKQDTVVNLLAGETRPLTLTLNPRFVMYKANFNFPDSLATLATSFKQKLNVKRLVMKVNGTTVVDSSLSPLFAPNTAYTIGYDYVTVNTGTTVQLLVYGNLTGWNFAGDSLLYSKTDISVGGLNPGLGGTQTATLDYVGPVTGKENLTFTIVKVGLYQITAQTLPTVIPKQGSK